MTFVKFECKEMARLIIRRLGIAISIICGGVLVLGFVLDYQAIHNVYLHQTGIRWLAEGIVAGLLLAAIGYWEND